MTERYTSLTDLIGMKMMVQIKQPANANATPESLRAAAKVLEDKAVELEKPKFTKHQQGIIDRAFKHDVEIIKIDRVEDNYTLCDKYADNSKDLVTAGSWSTTEYKRILFNNTILNTDSGTYNKFITLIDEDDEIHTYLEWA